MSYTDSTRFKGKVAIVTGATSGIGKTVAIALADVGVKVVLAGRREIQGEAIVEQILKSGGQASFFKADVSQEGEVEALVKFTVQTYGRLDLAFNNAGIAIPASTTEVTEEEYRKTFDLNVWGVLACMKHEIREMLKTGGGSIVNCSSVVGKKGFPQNQIYVASKHAVEGLTKSIALDYAKQGIRINAVAPGPIATEMLLEGYFPTEAAKEAFVQIVPVGRLGKPEEVIAPVLYLLDPASSFVTGSVVTVDGGILA